MAAPVREADCRCRGLLGEIAMWLTLYLLGLAALALEAPDVLWEPGAREFVVLLGLVGARRYSWSARCTTGAWCSRGGGARPIAWGKPARHPRSIS